MALLPLYPYVTAPMFSQQGGYAELGDQLSLLAEDDVYFTLDGSDPRSHASTFEFGSLIPLGATASWTVPADKVSEVRNECS